MESKVKLLPRPLRRWVRRLRDLPTRFREWPQQRRQLGPAAARRLAWSAIRHPVGDPTDPPGPLGRLDVSGLAHPFWFRHGTSDVPAIRQVFVHREYAWIYPRGEIRTIVDLGANVGAAAVFLLNQYPQARVIAVEPATGNFQVLERNLAPYAGRGAAVHAAVWSSSTPLRIERGYRDGLDWSLQTKPAAAGEAGEHTRALTVAQLLEEFRLEHIDLLKIDVEGAERELFHGDTSWLHRVRNLCVELHDAECVHAFDQALGPYGHERETRGETTVCRGLTGPLTPPQG